MVRALQAARLAGGLPDLDQRPRAQGLQRHPDHRGAIPGHAGIRRARRNEAGFPWEQDLRRHQPGLLRHGRPPDRAYGRSGACSLHRRLLGLLPGCDGRGQDQEALAQSRSPATAAYPVVWCAAGEATMPFYGYDGDWGDYTARARTEWTEIARYIRSIEPFGRLITIHPCSRFMCASRGCR